MTTLTASAKETLAAPSLLTRLWATNWPLTLTGLACLALLLVATLGLVLDPRVITGAPAWVKPMKFAISTVVYSLTLVWMLGYVKGHPRLVGLIGAVTAIGFLIELPIITLQVVRGVRSHFNLSTAFDATLFSLMGLTIMVVWFMALFTALLLMRQRFLDAAFAWSLRLGVLVSLVGMMVAFLMTGTPTRAQLAEMESGQMPAEIGAHSVGVEDGGPGLPFVGWSTEGGDLRVAHFIGLHGLQVLPLIGFVVNRLFAATLNERRRTALVWTMGLGYLGLVLLLTWQALRGQSVIAPDMLTLSAFAGLAGALVVTALAIIRAPRQAA